MNSTNFNVSGNNATTSIFITISESQKEQAERVEYEIKNSHTSTEEEDDDDETMYDSEEDNEDLSNLDLEEEYRFHKRRIEKLEEELLNERKMKEKEILHGRNYEKLFNGLKDESEILQLSVANHEKKYEILQNLYCEEKQRRIDAEDQYKVKKPNKMRTKRIESTHGKYCDKCGLNMYEECRCVCVMCDKLIYIDCNCDEYDDDDDKSYYKGDHDLCDRCDEILPNNCTCSESDDDEPEEIKHLKEVEVLKNELDKKDDEIKELDEENTKLLSENDEAKERFKIDQETIDELEADNKSLKQIISDLHTSMSKMTKQYNKQPKELETPIKKISFSRCGGCCETLDNCICYIKGDEQITDAIEYVKGQIHELKDRHYLDFPITGYGIEPELKQRWRNIHFNDAHQEAKSMAIKKEKNKYNRLIEENKQYKIKVRDQLKTEKALKNVQI